MMSAKSLLQGNGCDIRGLKELLENEASCKTGTTVALRASVGGAWTFSSLWRLAGNTTWHQCLPESIFKFQIFRRENVFWTNLP